MLLGMIILLSILVENFTLIFYGVIILIVLQGFWVRQNRLLVLDDFVSQLFYSFVFSEVNETFLKNYSKSLVILLLTKNV